MSNILQTILDHKQIEVSQRKAIFPEQAIREKLSILPPTRGFHKTIQQTIALGQSAVIAEIKKASPSKGVIRENFDPADLALSYKRGGATCLSVLTDEKFFQGHDSYLGQARDVVDLPLIRKDFIVDSYQIYESRLLGADAILLIVSALEQTQLEHFYALAISLELDVLVEIHNEQELEQAMRLNNPLIGINNRNLKTFVTDLAISTRLNEKISDDRIVVSESGISTPRDIQLLRSNGINAFLVGESLMRTPNPGNALLELLATPE